MRIRAGLVIILLLLLAVSWGMTALRYLVYASFDVLYDPEAPKGYPEED